VQIVPHFKFWFGGHFLYSKAYDIMNTAHNVSTIGLHVEPTWGQIIVDLNFEDFNFLKNGRFLKLIGDFHNFFMYTKYLHYLSISPLSFERFSVFQNKQITIFFSKTGNKFINKLEILKSLWGFYDGLASPPPPPIVVIRLHISFLSLPR